MAVDALLTPVRTDRTIAVTAGLLAVLAVMSLLSAGAGQLQVPAHEVLGSVLHRAGLDLGNLPGHPNGEAALWNIRFPRLAMGLLVGAALGAAGAVMQGIFGNPLAEPGVIGVSAGAGVGACAAIVFGWVFLGPLTIAAAAFATALVTTVLVYGLARRAGRTEVITLVLMGIAVNAVAGGLIAYLVFLGDTQAREQIVFWQLGSLNGSRWEQVRVVAPLVAVGLVGTGLLGRRLDLLALGERAARHLGVNVEGLRLTSIVLVTLLVSAGVAFAGIIGFVGLVVPHLIRMAIGPAHRTLIPASAVCGAVVLTAADLVARTAVDYADLPIGMLTAVVGGPFFFWLLMRARAPCRGVGVNLLDAWRQRLRVPELSLDGRVVLAAHGVSLSYGAVAVLREVDLTVRAGEVLALVGPNGAGKSTLLGVFAGDHRPDHGTVTVDGAPLPAWSPDELAIRRGVLLQQIDVSFPFTVTQVVRMGRAPWAGTAAEDWDDDVIASSLAETDLVPFACRTYTSLSGGERSRAALARVLAQEPIALLLDEPTASLDIRHRELVLDLARRRAARGDAVVLVLHDLGIAAAYADTVVVLSAGRVAAAGPPADVLTADLLTEVYQHPIEVVHHPRTGGAIILPRRDPATIALSEHSRGDTP